MKHLVVSGLVGAAILSCVSASMLVAARIMVGDDAPPLVVAMAIIILPVMLGFLSCSVRKHHLWRQFLPVWVLVAVIGFTFPQDYSFWPNVWLGLAPLLLVSAIWLIKRYWTIKP